jgi:hypothetical protein
MSAIIVDFKPVVILFSSCEVMYPVFSSISLKTIISILLSVSKEEQADMITVAMEESLKRLRVPVKIDTEKLEIFYIRLMEELEDEIYSKFNHIGLDLMFDSWVDDTTAILRVD